MPTDTNLPTMVHLYLEIVQQLSSMAAEHDSISDEARNFKLEIQHYLGLVRDEMEKVRAEEHAIR